MQHNDEGSSTVRMLDCARKMFGDAIIAALLLARANQHSKQVPSSNGSTQPAILKFDAGIQSSSR
jgi:hypothetical protein